MRIDVGRFVTSELEPSREHHISEMIDNLRANQARGTYASREAIAETVGVIAVSLEPPTISEVAAVTGRDFSVVKRGVSALDRVGFIRKEVPSCEKRIGYPPTSLVAQDELYEAIAITPSWQSATKLCILAALSNVTLGQARDEAISLYLNKLRPDTLVAPTRI